jgi:hypothetical protein
MDTQNVSIFVLGICHLFDFDGAFAGLAFNHPFRSDAGLSHLGIADDQFHKLCMIGWIVEQREIC